MVRFTDHLDVTIAVDLDVKAHNITQVNRMSRFRRVLAIGGKH